MIDRTMDRMVSTLPVPFADLNAVQGIGNLMVAVLALRGAWAKIGRNGAPIPALLLIERLRNTLVISDGVIDVARVLVSHFRSGRLDRRRGRRPVRCHEPRRL